MTESSKTTHPLRIFAGSANGPLADMHKRRTGFAASKTMTLVGDLKGKIPIIIDDVISSGSVLTQAPVLVDAGAQPKVHLAITHGVLAPSAISLLDHPAIKQLIITNTLPLPPDTQHPKLRVISIAPLLATIIKRVHDGLSISGMLRLT